MLNLTSVLCLLEQVDANLEEILIDHAQCEKKAAGTAVNLMFANVEICGEMTKIANEKLEHFHLVIGILERRNI